MAIFCANVNVVVEKDDGAAFDDFSKQVKAIFPKMFSSWSVQEESPIEINGKKTYYLSATYRMGAYTLQGSLSSTFAAATAKSTS